MDRFYNFRRLNLAIPLFEVFDLGDDATVYADFHEGVDMGGAIACGQAAIRFDPHDWNDPGGD